jgi:hypothetical protein
MSFTKSYSRDPATKSLINNDEKEYNDYKFKTEVLFQLKMTNKTIERMNREIASMQEKLAKLEEKNNV